MLSPSAFIFQVKMPQSCGAASHPREHRSILCHTHRVSALRGKGVLSIPYEDPAGGLLEQGPPPPVWVDTWS